MEQLKKIHNEIIVNQYTIYFAYETYKGNYREQQRIINALDEDNARSVFKKWSKTVRTMVNVKILGIAEAANKGKIIEL